jgi:hypothetical protein
MCHHRRMERTAALLALAIAGSTPALSVVHADCMCAANGTRYEMGETTCIRLSSGSYLARCEKVLNNSSWKKISDSCQDVSGLAGQDQDARSSALPFGRPGPASAKESPPARASL